jgi:S1-C subfamily serine protease
VLTIGYLILEADGVELTTASGRVVPAEVVAYDYASGAGLVRAAAPLDASPLKLGDSATVAEADGVIVAASGGEEAVRPALVVSRRDYAGYWEYILEDAIFTAPPHPGFAGAALLGGGGELLGLGYLAVRDSVEGRPVPGNMFVPVNRLKPILGELLAEGRSSGPPQPWLGLFAEVFESQIFVMRVASGGPAEAAGLATGDLILGVGDTPVHSLFEFYREVWALGPPGVEVPLIVMNESGISQRRVRSGDRYRWLMSHPARE